MHGFDYSISFKTNQFAELRCPPPTWCRIHRPFPKIVPTSVYAFFSISLAIECKCQKNDKHRSLHKCAHSFASSETVGRSSLILHQAHAAMRTIHVTSPALQPHMPNSSRR